jgi:diguanylate cyclase (GGDEF)-like protein
MVFVSLMGGYLSKVRAELAHSVAKIRDMAQRDSLTGLFNRRNLMETLERELERCERKMSSGVALCMIDLDHFKRINDTFGHPAGDEVLIQAGACISASIRSVDYVARYGGEEFVVLLDGDSCSHARVVCERMRADIARQELAMLDGLTLSASMGVACYKEGDTAASLLARADKALYQAKADGRNCVREAP